MALISPQI